MKNYWQSIEGLKAIQQNDQVKKEPEPEFSVEGMTDDEKSGKTSRRDFLKMLGFTVGYATLAASCETPVRKAIPYLNQPEEVTPGVANYYASTFYDGHDYGSILVKTREGRPIKIEGNELSSIVQGGTNARAQASILNLYDNARLRGPKKSGQDADWATIDAEIISKLESLAQAEKEIALLTSTIISPSTKALIEEFIAKYPSANWITYDAISMAATRNANQLNFGSAFVPSYHLDKADLVVGFNADFLGNYLSPVEFTKQYSAARSLMNGNTTMLRHIQYETMMSVTGGSADNRVSIKASEEGSVLLNLYNKIATHFGETTFNVSNTSIDVSALAKELIENKGKSVLISGTNDLQIQLTVNAINYLLGNYGNTINTDRVFNLKQGKDADMLALIDRMKSGNVGAFIAMNVNPAYDFPKADEFSSALNNVDLKISLSETMDETAALCEYVCPSNNYLESWNDAEPKAGIYSMQQPCINKIFDTRQAQESIMKWSAIDGDFLAYIEKHWEANLFAKQSNFATFKSFWNQSVHDGVFETEVASKSLKFSAQTLKAMNAFDLEFFAYEKTGLGNGKYANNPWLQELPDPITTATWDNYACISPKFAEEKGLKHEDVITINGMDLPVIVQPGMAYGSIAIAYGYGRTKAGKVADNLGKNVFPLLSVDMFTKFHGKADFSIKEGETFPLALTQSHHTMEGRSLVRETTLEKFLKDPASGNEEHLADELKNASLYTKPEFTGFQWGMAINLGACTGCGNCVISCQAENNVAVIGKEQVRNRRIMHWIRIDRYYSEDAENPEVFHQPVMCQHCDNAPCENVCPVAATPHSAEGLNQMAYNRCIGTRYCMNNCPYRVRRFNWFEYANNKDFDYNSSMSNDLGKLVLNPDVVVRSRGVVEKCSLCVQRIQEKKLDAKKENRQLRDGEIKTACQQSCPANAIVFGDLLDPNSEVSKVNESPRMYHLLEHVHTLPSTSYITKIRNKKA